MDHLLDAGDRFREFAEAAMNPVFDGEPLLQLFGARLHVTTETVSHFLGYREHLLEHLMFPHGQVPDESKERAIFHDAPLSAPSLSLPELRVKLDLVIG